MNGMSWGGQSVGSWVRDEIMMSGTSPLAYQTPSFQSESYLPKMEAAFMKGFQCCNLEFDSMHDLLQHFEEVHAQGCTETLELPLGFNPGGQITASRPGVAPANAAAVQQQAQQQHAANQQQGYQNQNNTQQAQTFRQQQSQLRQQPLGFEGFNRTPLPTVQDVDTLEDMEMDEMDEPQTPLQSHFSPQPVQYGQSSTRGLSLNVNNMAGPIQTHQGLRTSAPSTPMASQSTFTYQTNPTVSSVNTPALNAQPMQYPTPETSVPNTPAGYVDQGYSQTMGAGQMMQSPLMQNSAVSMDWSNPGYGGMGAGNANFANLTIDDPAKRLTSKQGGMGSRQQPQHGTTQGQGTGRNSTAGQKRLREQQQLIASGSMHPMLYPIEEVKPFKCPVIGCDKAYKNQNGLKYHRQHGHRTQQLKENSDGSYSIVDPVTSIPYPGTVGMEKEKPFQCETCGKRYKNLNGLKYHKQHAATCNAELRIGLNALPANISAMNANVAGAGYSGMGDSSMF
jgi:transcription factor SFP1